MVNQSKMSGSISGGHLHTDEIANNDRIAVLPYSICAIQTHRTSKCLPRLRIKGSGVFVEFIAACYHLIAVIERFRSSNQLVVGCIGISCIRLQNGPFAFHLDGLSGSPVIHRGKIRVGRNQIT